MAKVLPFRGLRYNSKAVGDILPVIAPPYDVIKPEQRVQLEAQHPNNIVRLILSQPHADDTPTNNQYTRAAERLEQWTQTSILVRDTSPGYYVYDQTFVAPDGLTYTRRALIAKGKLEPYGAGVVFPHERTLAAPKADRLNLMRACHTNLSAIFLLYSDAPGTIENTMAQYTTTHPPEVDLPEAFGSTHRLWKVDDRNVLAEIQAAFEDKPLVIADGHHRYETALAFQDEIRAQSRQWTGEEGYNHVMMNLVRMESPGLVVLAIHRLLSGLSGSRITEAIRRLSDGFEVQTFSDAEALLARLRSFTQRQPAFGLYTGDDCYRLVIPKIRPDDSPYDRLDVTILHSRVIRPLFGIDTLNPEHQKQVSYTVDTDDAIRHAQSAVGNIALLMNPTPPADVDAVATSGQTMPQKSTYFYPKMATGLALNPLRE